jgi:RNA-directed DNA polymerase
MDDVVILVDAYAQHDWLLKAVDQRLREELATLQVDINESKSRFIDLAKGESFGFLGFDFRRIRSQRGKWRPYYPPKLKQRTALLRKLKDRAAG